MTIEPFDLDAPRPAVRVVVLLGHGLLLAGLVVMGWLQSLKPPKPVLQVTLIPPAAARQLVKELEKRPPPPEPEEKAAEPEAPEAPPEPEVKPQEAPPPPPPEPEVKSVAVTPKPPEPKPPVPEPKPHPVPKPPEPAPKPKPPEPKPVAVRKPPVEDPLARIRNSIVKPKPQPKPPPRQIAALPPRDTRTAKDFERQISQQVRNSVQARVESSGSQQPTTAQAQNFFESLTGELYERWRQPTQSQIGDARPTVDVELVIAPDGTVKSARITRASRVGPMDVSIEAVLAGLTRLRTPPSAFGIRTPALTVSVAFVPQ